MGVIHKNRCNVISERIQQIFFKDENSGLGVLLKKKKVINACFIHLSLIGHVEGTLNVGGQVFKSSYEARDAKQLLQ